MSEGRHAWLDHLWMLASGWLLLLLLLLLLQLVFVVCFGWDLGGFPFSFFVQKLITTEKLATGNTGRSLLNTKILVNTKPSSDYEYRDIQIDEWIEKIG